MQIKEKFLIENGYYVGNINEVLNNQEIDTLIRYSKALKDYVNKDKENILRINYQVYGVTKDEFPDWISYQEGKERDVIVKERELNVFQKWHYYTPQSEECSELPKFLDYIGIKIIGELYPTLELNEDLFQMSGNINFYEEGDFIDAHKDGHNDKRLCVCLIYLNNEEEYKNNGGEIVLTTKEGKNISVEPIIPNFVVLDFTQNSIVHAVNMVKNNFQRHAWIRFYQYK
jgi:Rps23 Pro-64 3,4-dihydroxylase Tpa1-like proline 4-hydroxylase